MASFSEKLGSATIEIRATTNKLKSDLMKARNSISASAAKMSATMSRVGGSLTRRLTLPLIIAGGIMLKVAADFEKGMNRVQVLTEATTEEFTKLRNQAKLLGRTTAFSATQATEAMGFLAQAGFDVEQIYAAIPATLNLAAAAQQDLATTADQLSNIMQGFGMDASESGRATDVLAKAASSSNTNVSQLAEAMKFAAPIAKSLGMSIEETAAVLGTFGNAGIQGSMAGTSLRMGLLKLLDPSKDGAEALSRLGVSTVDSTGKMRGFIDVLSDLENAGANVKDLNAIFGTRAVSAIAATLDSGTDSVRSLVGALKEASGTAAKQASKQLEGLAGAMIRLKSASEGLLIAIADTGILDIITGIIIKITEFTTKFAEANPVLFKVAVGLALVAAVIGPLMILIGAVISAVPVIIGVFTALIPILAAVTLGFKAFAIALLMNPITWVIAGITAAVAALYLTWKHWDKIVVIVKKVYTACKTWLLDKLGAILDAVGAKVDKVTGFFKDMWDKVVGHSYVPDMVGTIEDEFGRLTDVMVTPAEKATMKVSEAFKGMAKSVSNSLQGGISSGLSSLTSGGSFDFGGMIAGIAQGEFSDRVITPFVNTIFSGLGFAGGGNPPVGKASLVGEDGPEMFVPSTAGTIVPNGEMGGGGSTTVILNNDFTGVDAVNRSELLRFGQIMESQITSSIVKGARDGGIMSKRLRGE